MSQDKITFNTIQYIPLDPILVMGATTRSVGFLAAAKSMRRKWVGMFAKALNSIPVERPQDLATPGTGKINNSISAH